MDNFWAGFTKQALALPELNLRNAMIAGVPLGALAGALGKRHTDKNPEAKERADKAVLSQKNTGIHPALMGAMLGPFMMAGGYGLNKAVGG